MESSQRHWTPLFGADCAPNAKNAGRECLQRKYKGVFYAEYILKGHYIALRQMVLMNV